MSTAKPRVIPVSDCCGRSTHIFNSMAWQVCLLSCHDLAQLTTVADNGQHTAPVAVLCVLSRGASLLPSCDRHGAHQCARLFITSSAWTAGDNDGSGTHTPPSPRSARSSRSLRGQSPGRPAQLPPSFLAGQVPRAFREPEGSPTSSYSSAHLAAMPAALQVM